ncbi:MAG: amino acid--[acyl-carrier-protein] ligase [Gammaproteobacteria bacterium]|nr:amino acid--[acyl-carrier-protein] ligase [Gammaproteobacteria bacterium]MBV8306882.1 amino acid--[acyl-carrier-protein] ligase [Gammaproteobacteria bacterium]MBV8404488.1 amino acid--[acyl-carrier-protein] ligase [Gammaproteobacteria bacterium]
MTVPGSEVVPAADDPLAPIAARLFQPLGIEGVYARTALYEGVMERLGQLISRQRDERAEVLRFPPVMSRRQLEKSGYLKSFPNLLGCVCALHGTEAAIRSAADRFESGGDWTTALAASDLVLSPAACYPLYPLVATRGRIPEGGLIFDVAADCFRREPSRSLDRLQSFRMREFVRIGRPEEITAFRDGWMSRARQLADELALPYSVDVANDPFFGRVGQIMAVSQIQQALKFELLIPYHAQAKPTACMSFNYHREHFGQVWALQDSRGDSAHTGCVAFGMDRLVVALFANHGLEIGRWPAATRAALAL